MFQIFLTNTAEKQLTKLDTKIKKRIISVLNRIRVRPHAQVKKLAASPYHRLRVGDFRIILDIQNKNLIIMVIEIGKRENIYR